MCVIGTPFAALDKGLSGGGGGGGGGGGQHCSLGMCLGRPAEEVVSVREIEV